MTGIIEVVPSTLLLIAGLPSTAAALYLAGLACLARRRSAPVSATTHVPVFDIVVPAHNEEGGIERTVRNLGAIDYPRESYRVVVVADNCTDCTAEVARDAGATVLERTDTERRGKGYALEYAFAASRADGRAEAVVVVDADTVVTPNLLTAFAARIAAGEGVAQADYTVGNVDDSWRTRLMTIAFTLFHGVRSLGRERLGLSCGLRGNGMMFTHRLLDRVPHRAFSIVEDLEYGIALGEAGFRVAYVDEAQVMGEMPSSERASRSQRARWEGGRVALRASHASKLLREALARRDALRFDLAVDLLIPPLSQLVTAIAVGTMISMIALLMGLTGALVPFALWSTAVLALLVYIGRGCALSGLGVRSVQTLLWAPVYVVWKLIRRLVPSGRVPQEWVRTDRQSDESYTKA